MSSVAKNNDDFEKQVQAYIQHMDEELATAQALLEALDNAAKALGPLEAKAHWLLELMWFASGRWGKMPEPPPQSFIDGLERFDPKGYQAYMEVKTQIDKLNQAITDAEDKLKSIDPNISSTIATLNQLIEESQHVLDDSMLPSDSSLALSQINKIIHQMCQVIMDKIQIDLAQEGEKKFGSDPQFASAVMQFAAMAIHAEFNEQSTLQDMQSEIIAETVGWQAEKSQAEADLNTGHWYDFITGGGPDTVKDHMIIQAASDMMKLLALVETIISPMIVSINPGMQEFKMQLDQLKKTLQKFLQGHGTIQELKNAMIAALSIMVGIIAETASEASSFDKQMSQATMASAQMHMTDSLAQEEVIRSAEKFASIMGKLLDVTKYLGMAIILAFNPTAAMSLMILLDAALNEAGVINKLQAKLEKLTGNGTAAAVLTGAIEAVGTAGGAALLEGLVQAVAKAAIEASQASISEAVAAAVKSVAESASAAAGKEGEEAAAQVAKETIEAAVETAQKKVTAAFLSKSIPDLGSSLLKGDLKVAMEAAQKEAIENAAQEVQVLADTAAKQGASVIGKAEIKSIAETSANRAVASVMKITEKSAAELGSSSFAFTFVKRAGFMSMATFNTTGAWLDLEAGMQGKNKKDLSEEWQVAFQIINTILEIIGTLAASGAAAEMIQSPGILSKILLGTSALNDTGMAIGSGGEAEAYFQQAGAVKAIAKDQAGLELMQFVLEQLQKDANLERDQYVNQMQQIGRSNLQLSKHFNDAEIALAEAMAVSAV